MSFSGFKKRFGSSATATNGSQEDQVAGTKLFGREKATAAPALAIQEKGRDAKTSLNWGLGSSAGLSKPVTVPSSAAVPVTAPRSATDSVESRGPPPSSFSQYGWTTAEWAEWSKDNGMSVHASPSRAVLLGMENFGNSCYANSVLQALYHCELFRNAVLDPDHESEERQGSQDSMRDALTRLFHTMALSSCRLMTNPDKATIRQPVTTRKGLSPAIVLKDVDQNVIKSFLDTLQRSSDMFDSRMHHDAHEFLNVVLNHVGEDLIRRSSPDKQTGGNGRDTDATYVHRLFQGVLTNETRCLSCETISNRDEQFLDLSINVSPHTSVTSCLRQFSESEMLSGRNKFFCDACSSLQEAEKRMKIKYAPDVLALHLKRFKWDERKQAYVKHACRVVFPMDLRLFNTTDEAEDPDKLYELFAIVVHIGSGSHQGHYVSIIKIGEQWALFDDESVEFISESDIGKYYGDVPEIGSAYVLFYQAADLKKRGMQPMKTPSPKAMRQGDQNTAFSRTPTSPTSTMSAIALSPPAMSTSVSPPSQGSIAPPTSTVVTPFRGEAGTSIALPKDASVLPSLPTTSAPPIMPTPTVPASPSTQASSGILMVDAPSPTSPKIITIPNAQMGAAPVSQEAVQPIPITTGTAPMETNKTMTTSVPAQPISIVSAHDTMPVSPSKSSASTPYEPSSLSPIKETSGIPIRSGKEDVGRKTWRSRFSRILS